MKYTIEMMCQIFKISKSGYYAWLKSGPSKCWQENEELLVWIKNIYEVSRRAFLKPLKLNGFVISSIPIRTKPCFPFLTGSKVGITGPDDTQLWGIKQSKSLRKLIVILKMQLNLTYRPYSRGCSKNKELRI
jgi:hypothetical protein